MRASDYTLTYQELYDRAVHVADTCGRWARARYPRGCRHGQGLEQVVAVLGILQAGAAYLPIDPQLPPERLRYVLGAWGG